MSKYLLPRKRIDEKVVEWERYYDNGTPHDSLPTFMVKQEAIFLLNLLIEKGFDEKEVKEELKKLVGDSVENLSRNSCGLQGMALNGKKVS